MLVLKLTFSFKIIQLTQMSELVRKGIVQASEDLQRENDEAVWQEGVLRHVPIVGSLYNWINPLQKVIKSMNNVE